MSIPFSYSSFNPYENQNGGTVVAIAGDDYAVIGADTRLSSNTTISTRSQKKLFQLSPITVLGATGCWCDVLALTRVVKARISMYEYENCRPISTPATAQMVSTIMYYKRFFPYNNATIVAGLDGDGKGCVFSYDMIGHFSRSSYFAIGSGGHQLQPVLDNQISNNNMQKTNETPLTNEKALKLIKDLFTAAAERDIHTGDSVYIVTMSAEGVNEEDFALRKD